MKKRVKPTLLQVREVDSPDSDEGVMRTVRADSVRPNEKQRDRLTPAQQTEAELLYRRIGHVIFRRKASWHEGFLFDSHPDRELSIWRHMANVVDYLWVEEPKVLRRLNREQLTRLVIAAGSYMVDIPSQLSYVNDEMVAVVRYVLSGRLLHDGDIPFGSDEESGIKDTAESRITVNPEICHGKPTIRGLRYTVEMIADLIDSGMSFEEILADYPDLEQADLIAAIEYASRGEQTLRSKLMAVA